MLFRSETAFVCEIFNEAGKIVKAAGIPFGYHNHEMEFAKVNPGSTEAKLGRYDIVEANNERLLQLINEILDLSKIEEGIVEFTITPVSLHPLCKEIHDALKFRCPEDVELVYEASDEEITVEGDKNRIFQVISNLIGNAFKFTTRGSVGYGYRLSLIHI